MVGYSTTTQTQTHKIVYSSLPVPTPTLVLRTLLAHIEAIPQGIYTMSNQFDAAPVVVNTKAPVAYINIEVSVGGQMVKLGAVQVWAKDKGMNAKLLAAHKAGQVDLSKLVLSVSSINEVAEDDGEIPLFDQ